MISTTHHEAGLADQPVNQMADGGRPVHTPRPTGGVHTPTTCGPSSESQKEGDTPQGIQGMGPMDDLGDVGSVQAALKKYYPYMEGGISPSISPSTEVTGSAKTSKTSMAARVQKIVQAAGGTFTVDEIARRLVKSSSISPQPNTPEEWESLRKLVSNRLGWLEKKGLLERVNGKNGTYRRPGDKPEQAPAYPLEDQSDTGRLRILRKIPKPLSIRLPLGLDQFVLIYPGDLIVVAGATNAGKTGFFLNLVQLNWDLFPVKYLTSELFEVRLGIRLRKFCEVYDISLDDWEDHVDFRSRSSNFAPAMNPTGLNVIDYLEIYQDFQEVGMPIKDIFKRQQGQPGVTFLGLQMKHGNMLGRGGALTMEKPFLYLTLDNFKECGLNRLVIEKAKDPARDDVDPNGMDFWFRIEKGCRFILMEKPKDADKLVAAARKQANGGK